MNEMRRRASNVELLRIIAMILIVCAHAVGHSNFGEGLFIVETSYKMNTVFINAIGNAGWGRLGAEIFIVISIWFLLERDVIKYDKLVLLAVRTWFLSMIITLFFIAVGQKLSVSTLIKELITPAYPQYWFITNYILFYLFIPFLKEFESNLDDKQLEKFCLLATIVVFAYRVSEDVSNLVYFGYLFFLIAFIKRKKDNLIEKNKYIIFILLIICNYIFLNGTVIQLLSEKVCLALGHFVITFLAIDMMYIFCSLKIPNIKIVNFVASETMSVYVLHENILFRGKDGENSYLWDNIMKLRNCYMSEPLFPVYMMGAVVVVFCVTILIGYIYTNSVEKIFKSRCLSFLMKWINYALKGEKCQE